MGKDTITLLIGVFLLISMSKTVISQNCGCSPNLCCSKYGYCGSTDAYCGDGCRQGPCKSPVGGGGGSGGGGGGGGGSLGSIVTDDFFNSIINQAAGSCAGKRFYTRNAFLNAANSFQQFVGSVTKREIAAMFAHFTHETGHFCYIEEINGPSLNYCDSSNRQYPCAPGKKYHGRGPIQLSWNYNYGAAGQDLSLPLLQTPESVSQDPVVAFKTGLWYWTKTVRPVLANGFGATIRAINGLECNGGNTPAVQARISYYKEYCSKLGVDPGANLSC